LEWKLNLKKNKNNYDFTASSFILYIFILKYKKLRSRLIMLVGKYYFAAHFGILLCNENGIGGTRIRIFFYRDLNIINVYIVYSYKDLLMLNVT